MDSRAGIEPGNAAYMRETSIAALHDRLLEGDPLAREDLAIVLQELSDLKPPGIVGEFGCGSGRTFPALLAAGWQIMAVDLSRPMLEAARLRIAPGEEQRVCLIQAPLDSLNFLADASLDAGICLFSTLGMIRGRVNRHRFLSATHRVVRNGGVFVVHAHNLWHQRLFPGGWSWIIRSRFQSLLSRTEWGDRWANTSGVEGLFIHSFRLGELLVDLDRSGWRPVRIWCHPGIPPAGNAGTGHQANRAGPSRISAVPLDPDRARRAREARNATGWTVVCRRSVQ